MPQIHTEPQLKAITKKLLASTGLLGPLQKTLGSYHRTRNSWRTARLFRQFIHPGDLCFDIGANVGDVSELMLKLGARVLAVEPQIENFHELENRFSGNARITLVPKAIGAEAGVAQLMVCTASDCSTLSPEFVTAVTESGRLYGDEYQWRESRPVEVTTLDELMRQHGMPAFVKIDVEGFEAKVIQGCSKHLQAISFEFTPERLDPALECIHLLGRLGQVNFNYTLGRTGRLMLRKWVDGSQMANILTHTKFPIRLGPPGDVYARSV